MAASATKKDRAIIVITKNYEPIAKINPEKAFCLLYTGRAEPYEFIDNDESNYIALRSVNEIHYIPKIIILNTKFDIVKILYKGFVQPTKKHVLLRDSYKCAYCGKKATTLDHVIPASKGGQNTWENLVAACAKCNNYKADKLLSETNLKLRIKPKALTPYDLINKVIEEFVEIIERDTSNDG